MNLQELNELDLNNIGDWPGLIKTILVLIICGAIGTGWYYFDTEDQLIQLKNVERQELQLFFSKNEWSKNARPLQAFLPTNTCLLLNMQRTDEGLPAQVNPSMVMSSFQLGQVQF